MAETIPAPAVAQRIKAALEAKDMSIRDLAAELGYLRKSGAPNSYTYNLLAGHQPISRGQLARIAQILDLDADDLYFDAGFIPPDLEDLLVTDRALLRQVRILAENNARR